MFARPLFKLLVVLALFSGISPLDGQQAADDSAPPANNTASGGNQKGAGGQTQAPASAAPGGASVCTVNPAASAGSASAGKTGGKGQGASNSTAAAGAGVQVNQYAGAQAKPPAGQGSSKPKPTKAYELTLSAGSNAAEIAPKLSEVAQSSLIDATPINPTQIVVLLDASQKKPFDPDTVYKNLQAYVALAQKPASQVFSVVLHAGTGKACDIAHAMVNTDPYITEITAVDDSRLLISLSGSTPNVMDTERRLSETADQLSNPITPTEPEVDTLVQRLYYTHDPKGVATIINDAYPNVAAQAMPPDMVVLSDPADTDDHVRRSALNSAQRTIARIDQPHPQVSVDAWSLQLAAKDVDDLGNLIPKLGDLAGAYNAAIDDSLGAGWKFLSGRLGASQCLDPLMRDYLTWTTRVFSNGTVMRFEQPYSSKLSTTQSEPGYGLGFATLYYPLSPNLIDMLVTLVSLCDPHAVADLMLTQMGTPARDKGSRNTCREEDEAKYSQEIQIDENRRQKQAEALEQHENNLTPPHPERLHLACVRRALVDGMLAESDKAPATSSLGQIRGALADFLFHYKFMVEYPDEFHSYHEPIAADTLDSALDPIVTAFDEDLAVFQASLQAQVANAIKEEKKAITYGYGGLVNLKVLSTEPGSVNTATQNYFDATPPATLNDLLTNLQTEGAAVAKSPLSSLVTSLAPAKTFELLTVLGQTLTPKTTTAHLGRGLDLEVTAHTLSGAIGAELDLKVQSTENGAGMIQAGSEKTTDDLNSRVSQHTVDTHVRVDSINLFPVSTLSSTLARGQAPWKPFDPVEVPLLGLLVKVPRKPHTVHTQSLVFVDAIVVPTAADLGYGVPMISDEKLVPPEPSEKRPYEIYKKLRSLDEFPNGLGNRILQYHQKIVDCLNREYIGNDGFVHVQGNGSDNHACGTNDYQLNSLGSYDLVQ